MDELSDIEIEGTDSELESEPGFEPTPAFDLEPELEFEPRDERSGLAEFDEAPRQGRGGWWLIAILVIVAAMVGWWFWRQQEDPSELVAPVAELAPAATATETEPSAEEPEAPFVVPALTHSDEVVAHWVATLSAHPKLAGWLANEALIERFVATIDNIAEGKSPRAHLEFVSPRRGFRITDTGGRLIVDPAGYQRYDTLATVIHSLDTLGSAQLIRNLGPLLDESYQKLGYPEREFKTRLFTAIDALLAVPIRESPIELNAKILSYELADPKLEGLSEAQKHLLRMGPHNIQAVQAKLRELRAELVALDERVR